MLRVDDYRAASDFLARLYGHTSTDTFPAFVARELRGLVGADQVSWNDMALTVPWSRVVVDPPLEGIDAEWAHATFAAHMLEHPCLRHWLRTGTTAAIAISDLVGRAAYHRSALYRDFYRVLGYEDQLAASLTPPAGRTIGLAFARTERGVSARDRAMLELVAPHILQAHRNADAMTRATRTLAGYRAAWAERGVAIIEVDGSARVRDCPPRAATWLHAYFAERPSATVSALPATVRAWLRHGCSRQESGGMPEPLVRRRGARRLTLRAFAIADGTLILLEEHSAPASQGLRSLGLSRRETEVLLELEAGRGNAEIAAALSISPGTVRKHLERIYAKLGVHNRTQAVARLRRASA